MPRQTDRDMRCVARHPCIVSMLVAIAWCAAARSEVVTTPDQLSSEYQLAEKSAPAVARQDLAALRALGKSNGWKFAVAYTSAFAAPLDSITGTKIPANFLAIAVAQNEFASKANGAADESARLAGVQSPQYLGSCSPGSKSFNWRDQKMVTPVQDQATCGSCWAFAAAATYDAAYRIRNGKLVSVSEQHILDCAVGDDGARAGSCRGGWYDPAYQWMIAKGVVGQNKLPYGKAGSACKSYDPGDYRAVSWGFVTAKTAVPLIREIKQSVCRYGPIASAMEATPAFQAYGGGYFNEGSNGQINHAVTIVGWDDNAGGNDAGAWLVKNSWGNTRWGEKGYAWIKYGSNKIGYAAAWVRPVEDKVPVPAQAIAAAWSQAVPNRQTAAGPTDPSLAAPLVEQIAAFAQTSKNDGKTVWIQYGGQAQREQAERLRADLTSRGFFAPAIEDISKKGGGLPLQFQIRYYTGANKPVADELSQLIGTSGVGSAKVVRPKGLPNIDAIEIWFPSQ